MKPTLANNSIYPFANWDIPDLIDSQANVRGEDTFLVWEPFEGTAQTWSYETFAEQTLSLASSWH